MNISEAVVTKEQHHHPEDRRNKSEIDQRPPHIFHKPTHLQRQLDATAIAALHHDNTLLRQELDATGILVTLDSHRP